MVTIFATFLSILLALSCCIILLQHLLILFIGFYHSFFSLTFARREVARFFCVSIFLFCPFYFSFRFVFLSPFLFPCSGTYIRTCICMHVDFVLCYSSCSLLVYDIFVVIVKGIVVIVVVDNVVSFPF